MYKNVFQTTNKFNLRNIDTEIQQKLRITIHWNKSYAWIMPAISYLVEILTSASSLHIRVVFFQEYVIEVTYYSTNIQFTLKQWFPSDLVVYWLRHLPPYPIVWSRLRIPLWVRYFIFLILVSRSSQLNKPVTPTKEQNRECIEGCSKSIVRKNNEKFGKMIGRNTKNICQSQMRRDQ